MKFTRKTLVAAAVVSVFAGTANAGDLSYNYANIVYVNNTAVGSVSGSGFGIDGSFGVADNLNITLGYQAPSFNGSTISETKVGVGYHQPIDATADWYGRGEYRGFSGPGGTASGFAFLAGARGAMNKQFELDGHFGFASYSGGGTSASGMIFAIDGTYKVTDKVGVTAGYMSDNDAFGWTGFKIGARMYF